MISENPRILHEDLETGSTVSPFHSQYKGLICQQSLSEHSLKESGTKMLVWVTISLLGTEISLCPFAALHGILGNPPKVKTFPEAEHGLPFLQLY